MTSDEIALRGVKMTPIEPSPIFVNSGLPWVTHQGTLPLGDGTSLRCYQLNDGRRIFDADDVRALLGIAVDESAAD